MDHTLREMTFKERPLDEIRSTGLATGALHGILADGGRKVMEGVTSVNEVLRVTRGKA